MEKYGFLVCTDLMARGMDFEGIKTIINYDFPQSTTSYVHRCGRTGRAGTHGHAITFWTEEDAPFVKNIINAIKTSGGEVPEWMLKLKKMTRSHAKKLRKESCEEIACWKGDYPRRKGKYAQNQNDEELLRSGRRKTVARCDSCFGPRMKWCLSSYCGAE
eukprot:UN09190